MRLNISTTQGEMLVLAEAFEIEGSGARFAVHRPVGIDFEVWGEWVATHVETGFNFAGGSTIEEAIEAAREIWSSRTPEQRAVAIAKATEIRQAIHLKQGEVLQ